MDKVEEVAKELYFEGEHFDEGSVADVTWRELPKARKQKYLDRAKQICQLFPDNHLICKAKLAVQEKQCQARIEALIGEIAIRYEIPIERLQALKATDKGSK